MLNQLLRLFAIILAITFLLPGCAYFSKSGRQQMEYQRYVKRSMRGRYKQKMRLTKQQQKIPDYRPSEYHVSAGVVDAPQAATSDSSGQ